MAKAWVGMGWGLSPPYPGLPTPPSGLSFTRARCAPSIVFHLLPPLPAFDLTNPTFYLSSRSPRIPIFSRDSPKSTYYDILRNLKLSSYRVSRENRISFFPLFCHFFAILAHTYSLIIETPNLLTSPTLSFPLSDSLSTFTASPPPAC